MDRVLISRKYEKNLVSVFTYIYANIYEPFYCQDAFTWEIDNKNSLETFFQEIKLHARLTFVFYIERQGNFVGHPFLFLEA